MINLLKRSFNVIVSCLLFLYNNTTFVAAVPDPVLDIDVILRLVRRHSQNASSVRGVDESGGEARTYVIDDDIIFKTQPPHRLRPRTSLKKGGILPHPTS